MSVFLVQLAQIAGSMASAASIFWAIYIYKTKTSDELTERLKEKLKVYEMTITEIDMLLSAPLFASFGYEISKRLQEIFNDITSAKDMINVFTKKQNEDIIRAAIVGVLGESKIKQRIDHLLSEIAKLPYDRSISEYRSLKNIIIGFNYLIRSTVSYTFNPKQLSINLCNAKLWKSVIDKYEVSTSDFLLKGILPGVVGKIMEHALNDNPQKILSEIEKCVGLLVPAITIQTKTGLRAIRKIKTESQIERKSIPNAVKISLSEFDYLKSIFNSSEWDKIVESRTLIQHYLSKYDDTEIDIG